MKRETTLDAIFDADGFMRDMSIWSEDLARQIAANDGLGELDEEQIELLKQLRQTYQEQGALPAVSHVCRLDGHERDCMTRIFPSVRETWRLAGLPNPGEEGKAYM